MSSGEPTARDGRVEPDVRGEPVGAVPRVEGVAEDDDPPARDRRAPDAAQQLLGLAREHRAADDLDPPAALILHPIMMRHRGIGVSSPEPLGA